MVIMAGGLLCLVSFTGEPQMSVSLFFFSWAVQILQRLFSVLSEAIDLVASQSGKEGRSQLSFM